MMQARTIALFYFLLAFSHCIAAVLRGSGNASIPMIVMLCVWCLFLVSYITVGVHFIPDIRVVFWAYPLTWSSSSGIFLYLFLREKWVYGFEKRKNRILERRPGTCLKKVFYKMCVTVCGNDFSNTLQDVRELLVKNGVHNAGSRSDVFSSSGRLFQYRHLCKPEK